MPPWRSRRLGASWSTIRMPDKSKAQPKQAPPRPTRGEYKVYLPDQFDHSPIVSAAPHRQLCPACVPKRLLPLDEATARLVEPPIRGIIFDEHRSYVRDPLGGVVAYNG